MIDNLENEIWCDIEGYEGLYQVSSLGRVKSLNYKHTKQEKVLKPGKSRCGYLQVDLFKESKRKHYSVHRLVAKAFIFNNLNLPCVNHKDENPSNNDVSNLEWCSYKYNSNYGTCKERVSLALKGKKRSEETKLKISLAQKGVYNTKRSKTVLQYDLEGNFVKEFPSAHQVQRDLGFHYTNICDVCNGKYKQAYNYIWRYKESI